jgi:hypothetical protein
VTVIVGLWQGSLKTLKEVILSYCQPSPSRTISEMKVFVTPPLELSTIVVYESGFKLACRVTSRFVCCELFLQKAHSKTTDLFGNG